MFSFLRVIGVLGKRNSSPPFNRNKGIRPLPPGTICGTNEKGLAEKSADEKLNNIGRQEAERHRQGSSSWRKFTIVGPALKYCRECIDEENWQYGAVGQ
jgi:hypothetical protein